MKLESRIPRLCASLLMFGLAGVASAQTANMPPNIHFIIDTSGSMRELPQLINSDHTEFFNITVNGCSNSRLDATQASLGWNPATVYPVPDAGTGLGSDTGFPNLFQDSKFYGYLYWADSSNPPPQWDSKEQVCQDRIYDWSTTGAAEYNRCLSCLSTKGYYKVPGTIGRNTPPLENGNFVFWGRFLNFNPPKYVTIRAALKQLFKSVQGVRAGYSTFSNYAPSSRMGRRQAPACDQSMADPSAFDVHRASFINDMNALTFTTGTPLARALLNAGYYFTSGDEVYRDKFGFGTTGYTYPADFRNDALTSQSRSVCLGCQQSAIVLVTDGEPTGDTLTSTVLSRVRTLNGGPVYCPDWAPCGSPRDRGNDPVNPADDNGNYLLDDVAKLLATRDLQDTTPAVVGNFDTSGQQSLRVFTVAYAMNSNLLKHTAPVGHGTYYTAEDGSSLQLALQSIIYTVKSSAPACTGTP